MNSRDQANLDFLLNSDKQDFEQWLEKATPADIDYALEIIRKGKTEKMLELIELEEVCSMHDDDMTEAKQVIDRIKKM